jgi:uracil-DNA glycosylase
MINEELRILYSKIEKECPFCKKSGNKLQHIFGFGKLNPKLMLILINPTHRNLSSRPDYRGDRFPFIGVRSFWKVLAEGNLIDKKIVSSLPNRNQWRDEDTEKIKEELLKNQLFLTNIVKCCYEHADYPERPVIKWHLRWLEQEIKIVNPQRIVAFGTLVFKILTGKIITFRDYLENTSEHNYFESLTGLKIPVIPCPFPIGRGSPSKAISVLKLIHSEN